MENAHTLPYIPDADLPDHLIAEHRMEWKGHVEEVSQVRPLVEWHAAFHAIGWMFFDPPHTHGDGGFPMPSSVWDLTDPDNPVPLVWPECECGTPHVLKRFLTMGSGYRWLWAKDCKHDKRKAQPKTLTMTAHGPVPKALQGGE